HSSEGLRLSFRPSRSTRQKNVRQKNIEDEPLSLFFCLTFFCFGSQSHHLPLLVLYSTRLRKSLSVALRFKAARVMPRERRFGVESCRSDSSPYLRSFNMSAMAES